MRAKRIIAIITALLIINCNSTFCFANSDIQDNISYYTISANKILISDGSSSAIMELELSNNCEKYIITPSDGVSSQFYFSIDRDNNTIYSSITGKTTSFELEDSIEVANDKENYSTGSVKSGSVQRIPKHISYKKLADMVTPTSSQISWASAIITIIAAIMGVTIATSASVIVTLFSTTMWDTVRKQIVNRSPSHGIKAVVKKSEQRRHEGGKIVIGYKYTIESVGTY